METGYRIVVSDEGTIPSYVMYGPQQPIDVLTKISKKYLEIDPEWLDTRLLGVVNKDTDKGRELNLNYGVMIPSDIDLIQGRWVGISDYFQSNRKNLSAIETCNNIIQNMSLVVH
tara:strand:+ start:8485 stop:8829 length:345 start_codon:yes stop_codon:yes gene_type:complete